ncbi:hypothetical protein I79_009396 [Cricetulus griseus]|uniref:Uncharacterized protein n=1 Tax=Cricetulus griseus TaxID=10029 RepID=G3HFN3_CRIGR|nr:hypothetical protein I79_009396 [Cricetulus griseus]
MGFLKPQCLSLSSCCLWIQMYNSQLLLQHHVCLNATMLLTTMMKGAGLGLSTAILSSGSVLPAG